MPARVAQSLVVGAAWAVFVMSWIKVAGHTSGATMARSAIFVAVTLVVVIVVTTWWIRHNLAIYRRKGPRRSVPGADRTVGSDFMGRDLSADWDAVRAAPMVIVRARDEVKEFVAGDTGR